MQTITPLDYSHFDGGLVRMLDRFKEEGTLTGDVEADDYLRRDANAALLGLLYDQRVRAEYAFTGPHRLRDRLGHLDMKKVAAMDLDVLRALFARKPAVHRSGACPGNSECSGESECGRRRYGAW